MNTKIIMETAHELINKKTNKQKAALLWFITEIVQIIFLIMGAIMLLWLYAPLPTGF